MGSQAGYVLKAHGSIDADWLRECLTLFKERQVCIRKLLVLKNGHPEHFSMLELHFSLPQSAAPVEVHPFLPLLNTCLASQTAAEQSLTPLSGL